MNGQCSTAAIASSESTAAMAGAAADVAMPDNIQLIVAATAGGFADAHARIVATYLQETTGIPVAVVNQAEGGGVVAYDNVKNAKADGSTLLFYHSNFALACVNGTYDADPINDFTPIAWLESGGVQAIVVSANSPYQTLDDYINAALENPGTVTFAIQSGGASEIIGAQLEKDKNCDLDLVEAGNQTEKIASLLGGYIDACNIGGATAAQYVESGDMRVLCSLGKERDPFYPDFVPAAEQGYPSVVYESDFWLHGPADMDPALVEALNGMFKDMESNEKVKEQLEKQTSFYTWRDVSSGVEEYQRVVTSLEEITNKLNSN